MFLSSQKKLIDEKVDMSDAELLEMIKKLKFQNIKDLKLTNREADR